MGYKHCVPTHLHARKGARSLLYKSCVPNVLCAEQWLLRFDRVASTVVAEVLALALECRDYFYNLAVGRLPPVHYPYTFYFIVVHV